MASQSVPDIGHLYDGEGELLMSSEQAGDRVTLLPSPHPVGFQAAERVRILWGQDMLRDLIDGRYRVMVCGVNESDNSHGIISQVVEMVRTSQWTTKTITSYAKVFQDAVSVHAASDREPYILKFDLDSLLILGLLRPRGKDHFTLADLSRGFQTVVKMLDGRIDRRPVCSVSFQGARSNKLLDRDAGDEPSFESILRTMYEAGFRGDIYPAPQMWQYGHVGVYPAYPFPESLERMREGGH
jgi:hypothetical protein